MISRSSIPEVFLGKGVLKIDSKFTGEHPYRRAISIKLLCSFIEIALRHGCSPVNLLHIFRTPFLRTPLDGCFWIYLLKSYCFQCFKIILSNSEAKYSSVKNVVQPYIMEKYSQDTLPEFFVEISNLYREIWKGRYTIMERKI